MTYFKYKRNTIKTWKEIKKNDIKNKVGEIIPSNVLIKSYKDLINNKEIEFNLYYKDDSNDNRPIIIDIHGGGWAYGDKDSNNNFCAHLANFNYNVASLTYGLMFKSNLKDMIKDISSFIEYLYKNKDKYHLDFNNLFITGDSAGGNLSFLYSVVSISPTYRKLFEVSNIKFFNIKGLALNHGVYDFNTSPSAKFNKLESKYFYRSLYNKNYLKSDLYLNTYKLETIISNLKKEGSLSLFPPSFIISSVIDSISYDQSVNLFNGLKDNITDYKVDIDINESEDAIHIYNVFYPNREDSKIVNSKINDFFLSLINK